MEKEEAQPQGSDTQGLAADLLEASRGRNLSANSLRGLRTHLDQVPRLGGCLEFCIKRPNTPKALTLLKNISPVAWQHFHFHYTLIVSKHPINLDTMVAHLTLEEG